MLARSRYALSLAVVLFAPALFVAVRPAAAIPNPVATDPVTYAAFGRVFPDPHGCHSADIDGDDLNDVVAPNTSPWAKGNVCVEQFLQYEEAIAGTRFLESIYPRFLEVIRLDEAYDNPNYQSAGNARAVVIEDGKPKLLGRDRRPLYLFKVTDEKSPIPESERLHFAYGLSIHGIERAGVEGGLRAMEDLVTWAASYPDHLIVEAPTKLEVPKARETLRRSVIYFIPANPDGWGRGQVAPVEFEDGSPNLNYTPGPYFQRYNGNGVDMNRDWPNIGYTFRPYSPLSEPETRAYYEVLRRIRRTISPRNPVGSRFAGGIDLHGQLTANAFSFTLMGAGQRDFRENFSAIDQGLRAYHDQTGRLSWSPYIGTLFEVADQWGTTIDTIGYQVTGALGDWFDSEQTGLGAVGIDNEMSLSHLAPNNVFEPTLEQMHIDGNKGLIFSQISSMLTEDRYVYHPPGKIGYVFNPKRIRHPGSRRLRNPGLPAQNDIDVIVPCQSAGPQNNDALSPCREEGVEFVVDGTSPTLEFRVKSPRTGVWNGGLTATVTHLSALGLSHGTVGHIYLEHRDRGEWQVAATSYHQGGTPDLYIPGGQITTVNDPVPGRWRLRLEAASGPSRVTIDFNRHRAEAGMGQAPFSASSMDFFTDLNRYVKGGPRLEAIPVDRVISSPTSLDAFDTIVVVNNMGDREFLTRRLGLSTDSARGYFTGLKEFAEGGGNLVLTDAALYAIGDLGVAGRDSVIPANVLAGRYEFNRPGGENLCNEHPLTEDVCLEGTAGGTSRQAVEPTPLGYTPDTGEDSAPDRMMPTFSVDHTVWEERCGADCTLALVGTETGLGERRFGKGVIRIVGSMFPDPNYAPGGVADMRFGVSSYALTFSAWQVFLNLVDHRR